MPQFTQGAQQSGTLGGSRGGIGAGQAALGAQRNIQDFGAQLYNQDMNRMLQAAQTGAGMYGQGQSAGLTAAGMLPGLATAGHLPFLNQAQILGSPITLTSGGGSQSKGKSWSL